MSDANPRALERRAEATGDAADRAAVLRARLRAGSLDQQRVELAAYCGDEASRLAVSPMKRLGRDEPGPMHRLDAYVIDQAPFADWLTGLEHFGPAVMVRAALAGAWRAWEKHDGPHCPDLCGRIETALDACAAWLAEPTPATRGIWYLRGADATRGTAPGWLPKQNDRNRRYKDRAYRAARVAGEGPVRAAICEALIKWSLT